jgi:hypothetical protein
MGGKFAPYSRVRVKATGQRGMVTAGPYGGRYVVRTEDGSTDWYAEEDLELRRWGAGATPISCSRWP